MICVGQVLICPKPRRAVIVRLATARRVFGRIDVIRQKDTSRSGRIVRPFGSLAPQRMNPYQVLNWLTTA